MIPKNKIFQVKSVCLKGCGRNWDLVNGINTQFERAWCFCSHVCVYIYLFIYLYTNSCLRSCHLQLTIANYTIWLFLQTFFQITVSNALESFLHFICVTHYRTLLPILQKTFSVPFDLFNCIWSWQPDDFGSRAVWAA